MMEIFMDDSFSELCIDGHNYVVKLLFDHSESKSIDFNG